MSSPSSRSAARFPTIPTGEVVGSYETYERAQAAVDQLARADFPLDDVSIVGSNLKSVERVTGKMNAGRAALGGLLSGVMLGVFVGLLVLILTPQAGFATLLPVMMVAIGFSVLWSLLTHLWNPRKKEFTSVMQILAAHFDLVVAPELAARARQVLGTHGSGALGSAPGAAHPSSAPGAPSEPTAHAGQWPHAGQGADAGQGPDAARDADAARGADAGQQPDALRRTDAGQWPDALRRTSEAQPGDDRRGLDAAQRGLVPGAAEGSASQPAAPAAPAQRPRTYGEAQDALRRERERAARELRGGGAGAGNGAGAGAANGASAGAPRADGEGHEGPGAAGGDVTGPR